MERKRLALIGAVLALAVAFCFSCFGTYTGDFSQEQRVRYGPWAVVAGASEGLGAGGAGRSNDRLTLFGAETISLDFDF